MGCGDVVWRDRDINPDNTKDTMREHLQPWYDAWLAENANTDLLYGAMPAAGHATGAASGGR